MTTPTCSTCHLTPLLAKAGAVILLVDDRGKATCVRCFTGGKVAEGKPAKTSRPINVSSSR